MPALPKENKRVVLAERPNRGPITSKTFKLESAPVPELKDGQILVRVSYTSIVSTPFLAVSLGSSPRNHRSLQLWQMTSELIESRTLRCEIG